MALWEQAGGFGWEGVGQTVHPPPSVEHAGLQITRLDGDKLVPYLKSHPWVFMVTGVVFTGTPGFPRAPGDTNWRNCPSPC